VDSGAGILAAPVFDTSVANAARMYDYWLGGKDNFAADRAAADAVTRHIPYAAQACRQNRAFLARAVHTLAEVGISQFLDIGAGLPTQSNVHQIAQAAAPDSLVVYVDYDPVVVTHAEALLAEKSRRVTAIEGDLRQPEQIISGARQLLDFSKPVAVLLFAVLLFAVLHFITDDEQPHAVVRSLTEALVPGSAAAISHITGEGTDEAKSKAAQKVYQGASAPVVPRSRADITRFFDGLNLLFPKAGVTDINRWPEQTIDAAEAPLMFYGGWG
jgi:hypothetical protein